MEDMGSNARQPPVVKRAASDDIHYYSSPAVSSEQPFNTQLGSNLVGSVYGVYVLAILSNFVFYCSELPLLRLAENKICHANLEAQTSSGHFLGHGIDETRCKTPEIQDALAWFIGAKTAFDALPPLLMSLWYGHLAGRIGRRPVIALACTGELFNLLWVLFVCLFDYVEDYQVAWLAALFLLVGGGQFLLYAMFSLVIVDVVNPTERTSALSILHSITLISSLFGAPVAAVLMRQSLVLPFLVIILLSCIRYSVVWWLPETAPASYGSSKIEEPSTASVASQASETDSLLPSTSTQSQKLVSSNSLAETLLKILTTPAVPFCLACFLFKRVAFTSETLMFQHASELLHQPLNETAWLRVPIGLTATIVLTLVLPLVVPRLKRDHEIGADIDLWAVRTSLVILTAGFMLFWRASLPLAMALALVLCGAGEGLAPSLQSLVSGIVEQKYQSDLFATISVVDTIAKLIGGPVMAGTFAIRDPDGKSFGFCFLLAAILFVLLLCSSWTRTLRTVGRTASHQANVDNGDASRPTTHHA